MAFGFYSPVTVNVGQVPSTQADFPMLVSFTDNRFKSSPTGHVQNSSGFDIRPYSDTGLTLPLTYELERYNSSTGEVIMWVKVPSISSSTTPIYLAYGDSGLNSDGSSTSTWSNNFTTVYHLKDGTTLNLNDSTSGALTLSNFNTVTPATGQIDGAAGFVSTSTQYLGDPTIPIAVALTYSVWVNGTTFPNDYNGVVTRGQSGIDSSGIFVKSNGKIYCIVSRSSGASSYDGTGSHTLVAGNWYYLVITYDSTNGLIGYVNAASDGTAAPNGGANTSVVATSIGRQRSTASRYWNGTIDEVRVSSVARSADWITTEYNNQLAPTTFASLGTEANFTPISGLYRIA